MRARFWNAGHLLGSASIELEFEPAAGGRPLTVLASGDIGPNGKLFQPDPDAPSGIDYVVSESTYGDTDRPDVSSKERRKRLADELRAARSAGGALLIPAFATVRSHPQIVRSWAPTRSPTRSARPATCSNSTGRSYHGSGRRSRRRKLSVVLSR